MKVRGADGSETSATRIQDGRVADKDAARGVNPKTTTDRLIESVSSGSNKSSVDTVKFSSLGAMMRQELDPTKMKEERRAKIDALKEQIRNGTYSRSSDAVAQSMSEEVSLEILLSGSAPDGTTL